MKITNCLDITLNLNDGLYRPYRKPNEETNYIYLNSGDPPSIIKEILRSIETRLSNLSSSKDIFQESAIYYEECLKNSRYKTKPVNQQRKEINQRKKKRKRNIIWFNLPYSKSVKTDIGRIFIKLIGKHFPPNHKFVKIFNKNTIKLNYCCMPNIRSKKRSQIILQPKPAEPQKLCNCLVKEDWPLNGLR